MKCRRASKPKLTLESAVASLKNIIDEAVTPLVGANFDAQAEVIKKNYEAQGYTNVKVTWKEEDGTVTFDLSVVPQFDLTWIQVDVPEALDLPLEEVGEFSFEETCDFCLDKIDLEGEDFHHDSKDGYYPFVHAECCTLCNYDVD